MSEYLKIFFSFLKIGALTIGGGYAMLPIAITETVDKHKWVTKEELLDSYALAQSIPGIIFVNTSAIVGYRIKKLPGSLVAILGSVLPSFIIILILASSLISLQNNPIIEKAFSGMRIAVAALLTKIAFDMIKKSSVTLISLFISIIAFTIIVFTSISPILVVPTSAIIGLLFFRNKSAKNNNSPQ